MEIRRGILIEIDQRLIGGNSTGAISITEVIMALESGPIGLKT